MVLDGDICDDDDGNDEAGMVVADDGSWFVLPGIAEVLWILLDRVFVGIGLWVMIDVWLIDSEHVVVAFPDK